MSKALFRFLRGELNGYYLYNINNALNKSTENMKLFLGKFYKLRFQPNSMDNETIYNIGKFAGVFLPRLSSSEGYGSFRMSESYVANNEELSERGLYAKSTETFNFEYALDESVDINTHATNTLRSSIIGNDDTLEGYIDSTETKVLDDEGEVIESKVKHTVPEDVAYSDYYGNQFTYLTDPVNIVHNIDVELFYPLYKVMQYIRYNGASLSSICNIIETICPNGMIQIVSISKHPIYQCIKLDYKYTEVELDFKSQRIATMLYVMEIKFPQILLTEITE